MYNDYYGFSEEPFNVTPDPRFLYLTPSHREALASMMYGIKERKGFISITGEVGTGKTTLVHTLLMQLDERVKSVFIFHTHISFEELLKTVLTELDIPVVDQGKAGLLHALNENLIRRLSQNENVALIIDEAQNLGKEVLEELRQLSNLETPRSKLLQIILVGQPELEAKLNSPELRQLK
jgi:general secretion pathway protein A